MSYDPFLESFEFEFEKDDVASWWGRAAAWSERRGAPAITSLDLALAAVDEDDSRIHHYCACRLSTELLLSAFEGLDARHKAETSLETVRGPLAWAISGELNSVVERYHSLRVSLDPEGYLSEEDLFFYALVTCDHTLLARVFEAVGVDRRAGELFISRHVSFPKKPPELDHIEPLFPWNRPFGEFILPPEAWHNAELSSLTSDQLHNYLLAWRLEYLKSQLLTYFLKVAASPPIPGMVIHFIDGDRKDEDVVVYDGLNRQWWSLLHLEQRLESAFSQAEKTYYLRNRSNDTDLLSET